jgi:CheY-like chemotaxis protein
MSESPIRILVADDAATVHRMFRKAVQQVSFPVEMVGVGNGRDCLGMLTSGEFGRSKHSAMRGSWATRTSTP